MSTKKAKRPSPTQNQSFNLRDAVEDFILSRHAIQCQPRTIQNYAYLLTQFAQWLEAQGVTTTTAITPRLVRAYLARFSDKSDWTARTVATRLKTFLRFLHAEGYLPEPIPIDMPRLRERRLPFLTAEQVQRLLAFCNPREKAVVMLMVDSGLRRQEVCNLNRSDIDLKSGLVRVRQGKGRKDRITVIGATTRRALLRYWHTCPNQDEDAPAIQTDTGERLTGEGLRSLLRRLGERIGVHVTPHMLRRSFATLALKAGLDVITLQAMLGHSRLETTRNYVQWLEDDILEARKHSPIDRLKQ